MMVNKVFGLKDGTTEHDLSLLKSWSDAKVYQLPYWKLVTYVLSYDIDAFSKSLMTQAEAAEVGTCGRKHCHCWTDCIR